MANERTSMLKIRQILRMNEEGYSKREIVLILGVHRDTVTKYIMLFKSMKLSYSDLKLKTDSEIDKLFLAREAPPDDSYEHLQSLISYFEKELGRPKMTRTKLWEEYKDAYPGGYNLSQFNEYIRRWLRKNDAVMHFEHKASDKMFIDYAGLRLHLTDRKTGEMNPVEVFLAVLGSSQMTYVEASASQKKEDFNLIGARVQIVPYSPESGMFTCKVVKVNVVEDERGELFEVTISRDILNNLKVVRVDSNTKHLILVAAHDEQYLCGAFRQNLFIKNIFRRPVSDRNKSSFGNTTRKKLSGSYLNLDKITGLYRQSPGGKKQYIR